MIDSFKLNYAYPALIETAKKRYCCHSYLSCIACVHVQVCLHESVTAPARITTQNGNQNNQKTVFSHVNMDLYKHCKTYRIFKVHIIYQSNLILHFKTV